MKKIIYIILDSFFLLRPVVLIPVWGFAIFGYFKGRGIPISGLPELWRDVPLSVFLWVLIFSISVACVYVLNQIADFEVDKKNYGLPLLARGIVSKPAAIIMVIITAAASTVPALFAGRPVIALLSIITIATGFIYSFRPTFFSGRSFADFLTNAFGFGIVAFAAGWSLAGRRIAVPELVLSALPYFLLMCAGSISSTLPDIAADRGGGKKTTAVALGAESAHLLAGAFVISALLDAFIIRDWVAAFCSAAALPLYLLQAFFPRKLFEEAVYKAGGVVCMLAAAVILPHFAVAGITVTAATWMYFRVRHGVAYPSLMPAEHQSSGSGKTANP